MRKFTRQTKSIIKLYTYQISIGDKHKFPTDFNASFCAIFAKGNEDTSYPAQFLLQTQILLLVNYREALKKLLKFVPFISSRYPYDINLLIF